MDGTYTKEWLGFLFIDWQIKLRNKMHTIPQRPPLIVINKLQFFSWNPSLLINIEVIAPPPPK